MLQWIQQNSIRRPAENLKKIAIIAGAIFVAIFLFSVAYFSVANAAEVPVSSAAVSSNDLGIQYGAATGLVNTDIRLIIARIIRAALAFLGIILVCLILYAGFLWMTSGGNEEQISKAKKILRNAVIGLAIVLSAYAITLFVFKMLGYDAYTNNSANQPPYYGNLAGSGALGRIVKDHYPIRDQKDVPRNTKIVITFFKPIKLEASWITEKSGDSILGNCKATVNDYANDCDQLVLNNEKINVLRITRTKNADGSYSTTETSVSTAKGAAIFASIVNGKTDTIVIRPNELLGSPSEDVTYKVIIGKDIKWDDAENDNPGIFDDFVEKSYYWQFTCNTTVDSMPPYVVNVYPGEGKTEFKNTEVQVTFSEPVDPTGIQGMFTATSVTYYVNGQPNTAEYYQLDGNNVFLQNGIAPSDGFPSGTMKLTGNYRVLTFTPSAICGYNACGKPMYCLPTPSDTTSDYSMMLKAAKTRAGEGSQNFESVPFTGVNDMAGNAMDTSMNNGKVGAPNHEVDIAPTTTPVFDFQLAPDNYWWSFKIKDEVDLVQPYLRQIIPGINKGNVNADQRWALVFSKRMRIEPLYKIAITEHPSPEDRCTKSGIKNCVAIPLWKVPGSIVFATPTPNLVSDRFVTTTVDMAHGLFIKEIRQYYLPELNSEVEDVGFNCFYPGLGPGGSSEITAGLVGGLSESNICDGENAYNGDGSAKGGDYCCDVLKAAYPDQYKAFCCNGGVAVDMSSFGGDGVSFKNMATTCRDYFISEGVSPTQ